MWRSGGVASGVRFKVSVAVLATLVALTALAITAVRATRSATAGANRVELEFAERVYSDAALLAATENLNLVERRVSRTAPRAVADLDGLIAASNQRLTDAIDRVLGPGLIQRREAPV